MWPKRSRKKVEAAKEALAEAEKNLQRVQNLQPEVQGVVEGFLELSRENNFAKNLREIMIIPPRRGRHA